MKKCEMMLREGITVNKKLVKYPIYESNILPFIRFMHEKKLDAAGWITIPEGKYIVNEPRQSNCQIDRKLNGKILTSQKIKIIAPFLTASFDIECLDNAVVGDFPLATKNYKKYRSEIYDEFMKILKDNKKGLFWS